MSETARARPLILVVDDFADGREVCAAYLSYLGFGVLTAADAHEALAIAVEARPDIVLMDLALPGMDGLEATRRLKADERTAQAQVVALTAHALKSARDRALEAGCVSVIIKPCLPQDLEAEIHRLLGDGTGNAHPRGGGRKAV